MPQRFLPRPVRRWLRKRFGPINPPAGLGTGYHTIGPGPGSGGGASAPGPSVPPGLSGGSSGGAGNAPVGGRAEVSSGGSGRSLRLAVPWPVLAILLLFGAAISAAALIQALYATVPRTQLTTPGQIGTLHWLVLTNGQAFAGTLESTDRGTVVLSDVFSLQTVGQSGAGQTPNAVQPAGRSQLGRRMDGEWHQPDRMAIPIERVLLIETVGRDSLVAKLIGEARAGTARNPAR